MRTMILTLKKLIFSVTALTLIAACSLSEESDMWPVEQNLSQPSPMQATLSVSADVLSSIVRNVVPTDDALAQCSDIKLTYQATTDESLSGTISAESLSALNSLLDETAFGVCEYTFALSASLPGNAQYVGSHTKTLSQGVNAVHFDLIPQNNDGYGGFSITIGYTGKAAAVRANLWASQYGTVSENEVLTQTENTGGGTVTFAKNLNSESERLADGIYEAKVFFYGDEDCSLLLNTYTEYVVIAPGRTSTATRSIKMNEAYTITYYEVAEDGTASVISRDNALFAGADIPMQFTRKTNCQLPQITKDGHRFSGWYTDKACTAGNEISEIVQGTTKNLSVYAKLVYLKYTVTFMGRDGSTVLATQQVGEGERPDWPAFDYVDGEYYFDGNWYTDKECTNYYDFEGKTVTSDITLYSRWYVFCVVTYYKNDGSDDKYIETHHAKDAEFSLTPYECVFSERTDGYYFLGWATSANAAEPKYYTGDSYGILTEPVSFYAVWSQETYTVTLVNSYDTSQKIEKKVAKNSKILRYCLYDGSFDNGPERYHQDGWSTSTSIDDYINNWGDAVEITGDVTYYALWGIYLLTHGNYYYDTSYGQVENVSWWFYYYGHTISQLDWIPGRDHYTFTRWYTDRDCTTPAVFPLSVSDAVADEAGNYALHIYAGWELNKYTVTFTDGNGETLATQTVSHGSTATKPENPTRTGHAFAGWYNGDDTPFDFTTEITGDVVLYAKWEANACNVTFVDDELGTKDERIVSYGSTVERPSDPTRDGYIFAGWYNGDALYDFDTPVTDTLTLNAKWTINTYTVTFVDDASGSQTTQEVTYGKTATKPEDPTREGYTFGGWTNGDGSLFDFTTAITGDVTLYAKWDINTYTVTFKETDGTVLSTVSVEYNNPVPQPADPEKDHALFAGWYTDTALTEEFDFMPITKDISVYAKWDKAYIVTIIGRDGVTTLETQVVREGYTPSGYQFSTRDGTYMLSGFYKDKELSQYYDYWGTPITKDTTLYSRWVEVCTITFYKNDGTDEAVTWNHEKGSGRYLPGSDIMGTREGYYFWGWTKSAAATEPEYYYDDWIDSISEDTSFYAVWSTGTYTITFINSYETTQRIETKVAKESKVNLDSLSNTKTEFYPNGKNDFTRPNGWDYVSYAKTADATSDNTVSGTVEATGDATYYVLWGTYLICHGQYYNENGDEYTWWYNRLYNHMDENCDCIPGREGYTFAGWYKDKACTIPVDFTALTDADRGEDNFFHVYAKWDAKAQTAITVELQSVQQDPAIKLTLSGSTFSAASGFTSYLWRIDGTKVADAVTNIYTVDTSALEAGVHNVTLSVRDADGTRYSATAVITVVKE